MSMTPGISSSLVVMSQPVVIVAAWVGCANCAVR